MLLVYLSIYPMYANVVEVANFHQLQKEEPPYAKWGRLAMKATKARYPNADIVDYLHIGADKENGTTTEKFKLWLRAPEREFGVFIDIRFHTATEEIIEMTFRETDR